MTEKSPEVLATADLTPISPSPLHISSPIVIPALQDQADNLCNMSLPPSTTEAFAASTSAMGYLGVGQNGLPTINTQDDAHGSDAAVSEESDLYDDNDASTQDVKEGAALVGAKGEDTKHSIGQDGATEDVSQTNKSSPSSDTSQSMTSQSQVTTSSHEFSTNPAQAVSQSLQNASQPAAEGNREPQELQKPQEQAVVAPSLTSNTNALQPAEAPTENSDQHSSAPNDEIDIQSLVDTIIGNASANNGNNANQASASQNPANLPSSAHAVSLPPRPPLPQQPASSYVRPEDALSYQQGLGYPSASMGSSILPPPPGTYTAGAPGTAQAPRDNPPPLPAPAVNAATTHAYPGAQLDTTYAAAVGAPAQVVDQSQRWEKFLQEERRYVSEAKWDRFPDGSRLFIGNLSSDRVSKREVFDIFVPYGRLAQISLKQAYGFVQYHTLSEGQAAMDNLQGIEVQGRKIHLEFSRTQKKDGEGEKRSKNKRDKDHHDGGRGRRDDYRPRQSSPRRGSHRHGARDSSRGYYDDFSSRGRSRSPDYGRRDSGHYRRRSPSPYRRHSEAELNLPRRYGGEVPDVQFLLIHDVGRDFISWVERAFIGQGLRVQVMFLSPHYPRDAVIHRQALEGVHAVVELDYRAQQTGFISLQVFDRSAGRDNVRYDQYQDLDPNVAASLVTRTKSQAQLHPSYGAHYPPPPHYGQPAQPPPSYLPPAYPSQPYPNAYPSVGAQPNANVAIQQILGNLQGHQGHQGHPSGPVPGQLAGGNPDVNRLLASMGGSSATGSVPPQPHGGYPPPANGTANGDSSRHVQDIMAQLAQFRQ
ncbi:hypothetical protein GGR53DRAFT_115152 [Hypoxylon sp. FL1150]|nr:hypothetical protein GGR53DRAFT_115152 [Hypoxylon sp. FL1150]